MIHHAFRHFFIFISLAFSFLLATVVRAQEPTSAQPELPTVTLRVGKATLVAELAMSSGEKSTGLMFRPRMADNHGMLFFFAPPQQVAFWMKNTSLPLSLAYLEAGGKILELHDLQPFDTTSVPSRGNTISYVLEMNQGWFDLNQVKEGDIIRPEKTTWAELLKLAATKF